MNASTPLQQQANAAAIAQQQQAQQQQRAAGRPQEAAMARGSGVAPACQPELPGAPPSHRASKGPPPVGRSHVIAAQAAQQRAQSPFNATAIRQAGAPRQHAPQQLLQQQQQQPHHHQPATSPSYMPAQAEKPHQTSTPPPQHHTYPASRGPPGPSLAARLSTPPSSSRPNPRTPASSHFVPPPQPAAPVPMVPNMGKASSVYAAQPPPSRSGRPTPQPSASPRAVRSDLTRHAPPSRTQHSARGRPNPARQLQPPAQRPGPQPQPPQPQGHMGGADLDVEQAGPSGVIGPVVPMHNGASFFQALDAHASLAGEPSSAGKARAIGSASGGLRPPHAGLRGAMSWGLGPNVFENDGRPGTRGGGMAFDLEGRPLTRGGGRPASRMQATQGSGPVRASEGIVFNSTGPLTAVPRTYAAVASSLASSADGTAAGFASTSSSQPFNPRKRQSLRSSQNQLNTTQRLQPPTPPPGEHKGPPAQSRPSKQAVSGAGAVSGHSQDMDSFIAGLSDDDGDDDGGGVIPSDLQQFLGTLDKGPPPGATGRSTLGPPMSKARMPKPSAFPTTVKAGL